VEHPNAQLMRKAGELLNAGDFQGFLDLHTEDVVMHVPGAGPLAGDHHAVSLVIQKLRRGGRTLEGRQTVIAHVREGKFSEVWFQPEDQAAFDEFFAHRPESAASVER
jgi:ketosteroid isomerase-like protein